MTATERSGGTNPHAALDAIAAGRPVILVARATFAGADREHAVDVASLAVRRIAFFTFFRDAITAARHKRCIDTSDDRVAGIGRTNVAVVAIQLDTLGAKAELVTGFDTGTDRSIIAISIVQAVDARLRSLITELS